MEDSCKISTINPKISVVVPAYNAETFLPACIDSILSQTYENIEIVIVNDGSRDETGAMAEKYKNTHTNKIKTMHLNNGGVMQARLEGVKKATGVWIGFVDSDDVIEPDMYDRLMKNAMKSEADISHCGYQTIVNGGERIHYFYNTGRFLEHDKTESLKALMSGEYVEPSLCNKLFKRELFHNIGEADILKKTIRINEDLLMNYLLFKKANKSFYEDFCPYHYIARKTSVSRSDFKPEKVLDPMRVWKYILEDAEQDLKKVAWRRYLVCCLNVCVAFHEKKEWKEVYRETKEILKNNRDKWKLLRKNDLLKMRLFFISFRLYKFIYGIYERYFQKVVYE